MKPAKILLMLAALAGTSAYAVTATTVTFTGGSATTAVSYTGSDLKTIATAYTYNDGAISNKWSQVFTGQDTDGVGVASGNVGGSQYEVEGVWKEYIAFDFSATATGSVAVSNIVLNFPNSPQPPSYFTYQWISALPSGNTPSVPGTFTTVSSWSPTSGSNTYSSIAGQGRYLILGAINGSLNTSNMFAVTSITYTSVPDGASTLALMGAAVATLGLAARRRRL
jgi:hypothetical protein